ncbi:hypothetical protein, partial [Secundilactobacillus collinoides]|uniref:hypothetical protein n=1 Tax=Secundilactobacillus collinoides TaxID=33960 RepID=UPI001F3D6EE9
MNSAIGFNGLLSVFPALTEVLVLIKKEKVLKGLVQKKRTCRLTSSLFWAVKFLVLVVTPMPVFYCL